MKIGGGVIRAAKFSLVFSDSLLVDLPGYQLRFDIANAPLSEQEETLELVNQR